MKKRPGYRGPVDGLFLCGASTRSGHGIVGAMMGGRRAALRIQQALMLVVMVLFACGPPPSVAHAEPPPESDALFPLTRGEKQGQTYLYDATIDASRPCAPKSGPIELRLYTTDIGHVTLRLSAKNCTTRDVRFLHDAQHQPSQLSFSSPGKTVVSTDERLREKFDRTVHSAAFARLMPGEERVLEEGYFVPNGKGASLRWQSFLYDVPRGAWQVHVRFTSALAAGVEGKVPDAWLGTAASNAVTFRI
jgi:hypothetical protein